MSKYQTIDILKGNKTINIKQYFRERRTKLEEIKEEFGKDQTAMDEKFFTSKQFLFNEQENLFRRLAEHLGFDEDFDSLDIHISFSKKSEEEI